MLSLRVKQVIDSCQTEEQLEVATRYALLARRRVTGHLLSAARHKLGSAEFLAKELARIDGMLLGDTLKL